MFEKSLLDLVKGLRAHKDNPSAFISQAVAEIKTELKSDNHRTKAQAILKTAHLYMLGYETSWAAFNIIEVMSQPSFEHRRIGFFAAALIFGDTAELMILTTHLFKKALANAGAEDGSQYDSGCALNCLANIVNEDLAQSLCQDVFVLCNCSRPYLRKKAVLALYAFFKKFPNALRIGFTRIKDRLEDPDPGVQTSAVNVICELARRNPKNYLALAPILYKLLNTSGNNWMLIKLVKLMGNLMKLEPRLTKKLQEPLKNIITNTPAKSLLYECIFTATNDQKMSRSMVALCLEKLRGFIEDPDQNLKYLGLLGLSRLMRQNSKVLGSFKDLVLQCLDDADVTIRMRALELVVNMVTKKTMESIVQKLELHLRDQEGSYREHVLSQLVKLCSKNDYAMIDDFMWYIRFLRSLAGLPTMNQENAELISQHIMDVVIRVEGVRDYGVEQMEELLIESELIGDVPIHANHISRVLYAAAYVCGEFASYVKNHISVIRTLLDKRVTSLPTNVQCLFVQSAFKVVVAALSQKFDDVDAYRNYMTELLTLTIGDMQPFTESCELEVQERSTTSVFILSWFQEQAEKPLDFLQDLAGGLKALFTVELIPVHKKAQRKVAVPKGLNLQKWINKPLPEEDPEDDDNFGLPVFTPMPDDDTEEKDGTPRRVNAISFEPDVRARPMTKSERRAAKNRNDARKAKLAADPYYIDGDVTGIDLDSGMAAEEIDEIPVRTLDRNALPPVRKEEPKGKKKKRKKIRYTVMKKTMGFGDSDSDERAGRRSPNDKRVTEADMLAGIDLTRKAGEDEIDALPTIQPYGKQSYATETVKMEKAEKKRKKEEKRRRKEKEKRKKKKEKKKRRKKGKRDADEDDDKADELDIGPAPAVESSAPVDLLGFGISQAPAKKNAPVPLPGLDNLLPGGGVSAPPQQPMDFDLLGSFGGGAPQPRGSALDLDERPSLNKPPPPFSPAPLSTAQSGVFGLAPAPPELALEATDTLLFSNGDVAVCYTLKPSKKGGVNLVVRCVAVGESSSYVTKLKLALTKSKQFKFKHESLKKGKDKKRSAVLLSKKLKGGAKKTNKIGLSFKKLVAPERINCNLSYTKGGTLASLDGTIVLRAAGFFVPSPDDFGQDELRDVLSDSSLCSSKVTAKLPSSKKSTKALLGKLRKTMKLQKIDGDGKNKGTFYRKLAGDNHMALQVKGSKGSVTLSLRSTTKALAEDLLESAKALLRS